MRTIFAFVSAALFIQQLTAVAQVTTITFNEPGFTPGYGPQCIDPRQPKGTQIHGTMIVPGVVGSTENNAVSYVTSMAFIPWPTPPEGNYLAVNSCSRPVAGSFWISFVDACGMLATVDGDTVSVVVTDTEASPQPRVVVTTFGLDGQPIEERGITTLIETLAFTTGRVARVRFLDNGGDGHLLDTFTFGPITSQCYANCECDGVLDIFDFLCFGNKFAANDPYACDCDTSTGQGACDIFDFLCFGNAFDAGCP